MLKLQSAEPAWLDVLPGVRIKFAPISIKAVRAAREAVRAALLDDTEDDFGASDALSRELIRRGILEWEGIGDKDGAVISVTPETVEMFLADPVAFEGANWAYVHPWVARDLEKNASAGSPIGTGEAETPASDTAVSPAKPKRRGGANRTRKLARKDVLTS